MVLLSFFGNMIFGSAVRGALFAPVSLVGMLPLLFGQDVFSHIVWMLYWLCLGIAFASILGAFVTTIAGTVSSIICGFVTYTVFRTIRNEITYFRNVTVIALISSFCTGMLVAWRIQAQTAMFPLPLINSMSVGSGLFAAFVVTITARDVARKYIMGQRLAESPTAWMKTS